MFRLHRPRFSYLHVSSAAGANDPDMLAVDQWQAIRMFVFHTDTLGSLLLPFGDAHLFEVHVSGVGRLSQSPQFVRRVTYAA